MSTQTDAIAVLKCHEIKCNITSPKRGIGHETRYEQWLAKVVGSELLQFYELEIFKCCVVPYKMIL